MAPEETATDATPDRVVVGMDGSSNARHALVWAAENSDLLGSPEPVMAFHTPSWIVAVDVPVTIDSAEFRREAESRLAENVRAIDPSLLDRCRVVEGHTGVALCQAAEDADLLVVGTRGTGALVGSLTGSVSMYCAKHSPVPVVIIPEDFSADRKVSVVAVGVDGSASSETALRWAIDHADPDTQIVAVGAFSPWGFSPGEVDPPREALQAAAKRQVQESIERVTGPDFTGPPIVVHVISRDVRLALRELPADKVDLLVVGSRGETGLSFLFLGSVATALVHRPTIPTVIVPDSKERGR